MSVVESLLNLPTRQVSDNICRFCQKTFCCTKCRDRHVDKVHPDLNANCSLCASKTLPMRQFEFEKLLWENKKLLAHIADKHLPLRCILCENLFETGEDLKSIDACKWYSEHRQILINGKLPGTPASFEVNLKGSASDNSHAFLTPPEIYRNTSTPMFIGQKNSFEYQTPCAPNFSLKTPKTTSPSIAQSNASSKIQQTQNGDSDIKFYSFSPNTMENEGMTPFRSNVDDQFPRSNSGRKLDIKEPNVYDETEEVASNDCITYPIDVDLTAPFKSNADEQFPRSNSGGKLDIKEPSETIYNEVEEVALYKDDITSLIDMDLTNVEDNISQEHTPKLNVGNREESGRASDVVKKVRFSDQYETLSEYGNQVGFCVKNALNMTEDDDDVFHNAHDVSGIKDMKGTKSMQNIENMKNVKDMNDSKNMKVTKDAKEKDTKEKDTNEKRNENVKNIKDAKSDQVDDQERCSIKSSKDSLNNIPQEINISQENKQNAEKENRAVEALSNGVSIVTQKGTSRVLMMVLVENNSGNFNTDLMPLISSGLKKLEEQIVSPSSGTSEFSSDVNSTDYTRKSVTKMEMNVSSVESYSNDKNNAEIMRDYQQVVPTSFAEEDQTNSNGGILSTVAQAMRLVFKNLSGMTSNSINSSQMVQQRQIVEDAISLSETSVSCNLDNNLEVRYGKRARDVNEVSPWVDSVPVSLDIRSPLPKRKRGWYKIKGRQPIHSVRNRTSQVTSPRGVSSETQFFSQGSLTVGDTVLPLPARAYPEVPLAPAE